MARWIIRYFPAHRVYVEPFGGGASVLLQKPRAYAEIYNDLDLEVVNVFRVLRNPRKAAKLERLIRLTPFSREDFGSAFTPTRNPIEQARRTVLKSFAGFGSDSIHRGSAGACGFFCRASVWKAHTGFRSDSNRSGTTPAKDWAHYPNHIAEFVRRLQGVVIESRPALKVIQQYDHHDTLFYLDPPYLQSTRSDNGHSYRHEMTEEDHRELASALHEIQGMAIISGYPCDLYDTELYPDWRRIECRVGAFKGARTEVLWLSPKVPVREKGLFENAEMRA